jgi:transposase
MPRAYSQDLRGRVIEAVRGGASRREAAERFEISPSSAVKWLQHWEETGSTARKPTGGSISPLEEHADLVFELVEQQPDLTLIEVVAALRKRRVVTSRSSVWRFFERHRLTFKKKSARPRA